METNIDGNVTGIGVVTGGTINQTINPSKHKVPTQLTSKLGKSTIIGRKRAKRDRGETKQLKRSTSNKRHWWGW